MGELSLVERLRSWADQGDLGRGPSPDDLRRLAAARIEALEAENSALIGMLRKIEPDIARVNRLGAVTGSQWSGLATALIRIRTALSEQEKGA